MTCYNNGILHMKPKLLTTTNHGFILDLYCNYGVCILNTPKAKMTQQVIDQKN